MSPPTEELPDVKTWLSQVLNRMVKERRSAVLDLGGGDRVLQEYGRDLRLVEFCARRGSSRWRSTSLARRTRTCGMSCRSGRPATSAPAAPCWC
ncbi:hypothetical protein ACFQY5_37520 [Paeniroseomonas aquatica]